MNNEQKIHNSITAFQDEAKLASGLPWDIALVVRDAIAADTDDSTFLCFDDHSGAFVDLDLSGTDADITSRVKPEKRQAAPEAKAKPGRPKLGVVSKEVTLLPRHWDWLGQQSGGASATLRKLVEAARKTNTGTQRARQAKAATDNFMRAMLGEQPDYEDAARALYRGEEARFCTLIKNWPGDLRDHALLLAGPAFQDNQPREEP
ncbi:MAG: hypothetical protein COA96_09095 [SAR86 cluster bacterium]|uniref:DUF2239 domain-containing protein n=1 Tax=SAR86 cluster bacterium TaxID=2030880 RepID=A0A2A5AZ15_9GAMM|nr:MAG: hypothetical protein COA96_09095 [SAR86 cluster bacterium]